MGLGVNCPPPHIVCGLRRGTDARAAPLRYAHRKSKIYCAILKNSSNAICRLKIWRISQPGRAMRAAIIRCSHRRPNRRKKATKAATSQPVMRLKWRKINAAGRPKETRNFPIMPRAPAKKAAIKTRHAVRPAAPLPAAATSPKIRPRGPRASGAPQPPR